MSAQGETVGIGSQANNRTLKACNKSKDVSVVARLQRANKGAPIYPAMLAGLSRSSPLASVLGLLHVSPRGDRGYCAGGQGGGKFSGRLTSIPREGDEVKD